jgi:hypothetical protein
MYTWDADTGMYVLSDTGTFVLNDAGAYVQSLSVTTDQSDYAPLSTATFTVSGVTAGDTLTFNVTDLYGTPVSGTDQPWTVTASADGTLQTTWNVGADAAGQAFLLTVVDQTTGLITTAEFTDGVHFTPVDAVSSNFNGTVFTTAGAESTGTGIFPAFVELNSPANSSTEFGYNPANPPIDSTTGSSANFNHPIQVSNLDIETDSTTGQQYYVFRLDLNEPNNGTDAGTAILQQLKLFYDGTGTATPDGSGQPTGATLLYDLDGNGDTSITLADWSSGSGHGDYIVKIPVTAILDPSTYIYLYSSFSDATGGFEEWSVGPNGNPGPPPTPQAALSLTKDTVCPDDPTHSIATGTLLAGSGVEWTYAVNNTGDTDLTNIVVTDSGADGIFGNTDDVAVSAVLVGAFNAGDTNHDGLLNPGETWQYSATGTAIDGVYVNLAHVTSQAIFDPAHAPADTTPAGDDTSTYTGIDPHMTLVKLTNGADNAGPILAGSSVTWTYTLTNDGDVALTVNHNTGLTDDNGTPGTGTAALNDFHPTYVSGDVGNDGIMGVGEVWTFTASGTAQLGTYTNTATALAATITDSCDNSVTPSASDSSGYTGTFVEQGGTLTQGFWGSHLDAWDGVLGHESNPTKSAFNSGVLSKLDVNPSTKAGYLLLGDTNHDGIANDAHDLWITDKLAGTIESSSTSGDARIIMLQQAIATQLNIDNGKAEPNAVIDEAVMWLTKQGAWSGVGVNIGNGNVDNGNGTGGTVSTVIENGAHTALAGSSVATSTAAWHTFIDVTDPSTGITDWNGGHEADGEGLKNALMWWNDGHLVTTAAGQVAYDPDGLGAGGVNPATINLNTLDEFWLTLHQQTGLTGIA